MERWDLPEIERFFDVDELAVDLVAAARVLDEAQSQVAVNLGVLYQWEAERRATGVAASPVELTDVQRTVLRRFQSAVHSAVELARRLDEAMSRETPAEMAIAREFEDLKARLVAEKDDGESV